jgi:sulfite reductase (NADPH) flavoprotein alpha-component
MNGFSRESPFYSKIRERYSLNRPGSAKETQHIVLDLSGSGLTYRAGDCVAVLPTNHSEPIDRILKAIGATGDEEVADVRRGSRTSLRAYLTHSAELAQVTKGLMRLVQQEASGHHVWDLLEASSHPPTPQDLVDQLKPLMPRFYSIASSQRAVGEEIHLTVANFRYLSNAIERAGVCTYYLCEQTPVGEPIVPIYLQPTRDFLLPERGEVPIIMIGPGTGIAPFRGFLQERLAAGATGGHWLFFGEWTRQCDFLYQEYWEEQVASGALRLSTAFSRDQPDKIYVQHRMWEERRDLWQWLQQGAYLYVCGDAKRMAKDVEAMLVLIAEEHGVQGRAWVKELRREGRYLRDVY